MLGEKGPVSVARVLVTGASGFIGRHLVRLLTGQGHYVVAVVRRTGALDGLDGLVESVVVPGLETAEWLPVLSTVDFVVHLAGYAHTRDARLPQVADKYHRVNVLATRELAEAAARAGIARLVFISSVKAVGDGTSTPSTPYRETDPCAPHDVYGRSKRDAELILRGIAERWPLKVTVLRPPLVYGPGVKANFLALLRAVDRGLWLPLAGVQNRRSLVFVGNLVDAIGRCLRSEGGAFETFFVADDEAPSTPELIRRVAHHLGRPVRLFPFPIPVMRAFATAVGKRGIVDSLTLSMVVDTSAIRSALAWRPPFTLDQGLAETVRWYREAYRR